MSVPRTLSQGLQKLGLRGSLFVGQVNGVSVVQQGRDALVAVGVRLCPTSPCHAKVSHVHLPRKGAQFAREYSTAARSGFRIGYLVALTEKSRQWYVVGSPGV